MAGQERRLGGPFREAGFWGAGGGGGGLRGRGSDVWSQEWEGPGVGGGGVTRNGGGRDRKLGSEAEVQF